jgi:hypothetical protein
MSRLGQADHNDLYRVVQTRGVRQTYNEVHADVFPLPLRNAQRLQISSWPEMIDLDPSTRATL